MAKGNRRSREIRRQKPQSCQRVEDNAFPILVANRICKKGPSTVERSILLKGENVMQRGIFRFFRLSIGAMLCFSTSASSPAAQETAPTQPGVITSFAPIAEKVAPSVVTVFTTQTVSRTQMPFPFSDDRAATTFRGSNFRRGKASKRFKASARA